MQCNGVAHISVYQAGTQYLRECSHGVVSYHSWTAFLPYSFSCLVRVIQCIAFFFIVQTVNLHVSPWFGVKPALLGPLSSGEGTANPELMHKHTHDSAKCIFDCISVFSSLSSVYNWVTSLLQDFDEPDVPWMQTVSLSRQLHLALRHRSRLHYCVWMILQPENRRWGWDRAMWRFCGKTWLTVNAHRSH